MSSRAGRLALGGALIVAAIALLVVLAQGGGAGSAPRAGGGAIRTILVRNGKPVGGIAHLSYREGERVRFRVESDVADKVHLHGYDIMRDVRAGGSVSFDFPATIEGVFEAELEHRKEQILELQVSPR